MSDVYQYYEKIGYQKVGSIFEINAWWIIIWGGYNMMTLENIMSIPKGDLQNASKNFSNSDIPQLVEWLSLKDDNIRYQAFLIL